jgi:hypothetical protein
MTEPCLTAAGYNGHIELFDDRVRIQRNVGA